MRRIDRSHLSPTPGLLADVRTEMAGGTRLDADVRRTLERSFDIDLSAIRVHADPVADRLTRSEHTDAFAAGAHLFFRSGAYQPRTEAGLRLLTHEVTHTLQQARGVSNQRQSDLEVVDLEVEADRAAASVATGRRVHVHGRPARLSDGLTDDSLVIQRHESFEHRALGDVPAADIYAIAIAAGSSNRDAIIKRDAIVERETKLMWLWHQSPDRVTEKDVTDACPGIRTLRLQPSNLLVTYGELNALPDYIASAQAIDTCPKDVLLPILQSIRQETYYRLNQLRSKETDDRFALAPFGPHDSPIGLLNKIFNSMALDSLTRDLGIGGIDHYTGLLARNACHFAPYTWYRWQSSYLIARDLAAKSHAATDADTKARLKTEAWTYHGYADHFLQDSFAAGHLINKTLVMQWFVKWAATTEIFIEDWDLFKDITADLQPVLTGRQLYSPSYAGLGTDPQTVEEQATYDARLALSGITAYTVDKKGIDQKTAYQHYLTFLSSLITQAASNAVHDRFNELSLWVASEAHQEAYEVYGDDTFFSGAKGADGAKITSETAHASQDSIHELLHTGHTDITAATLRQRFPTRAGSTKDTVVPLETWAFGQEQWAIDNVFTSALFLAKRVLTQTDPRILNFSQDQEFALKWTTSLPDAGYHFTDTIMAGDRLFAASNSMLFELQPANGKVLGSKSLTNVSDETHIASDGKLVFAGVLGYVRATALDQWATQAWAAPMIGLSSWPSHVLYASGRLFAGSNGSVLELNPQDGTRLHSLTVSQAYGPEVRMATDGKTLFAGCHGYVYGVSLDDWSKTAWTAPMTDASYSDVSVLYAGGKLFAGSNGSVHQLDPATGKRVHSIGLSNAVDEPVRLTLTDDRQTLVAGCHGFAYGIRMQDWKEGWHTAMAGKLWKMVDVAHYGGHIYACSNGYIQRLDAATGKQLNVMQLSNVMGSGDYTPSLMLHPHHGLFVGMHGYVYNTLL
jgi:outer membrane protein assembly factor BamB